jgi:hypothetical protein
VLVKTIFVVYPCIVITSAACEVTLEKTVLFPRCVFYKRLVFVDCTCLKHALMC